MVIPHVSCVKLLIVPPSASTRCIKPCVKFAFSSKGSCAMQRAFQACSVRLSRTAWRSMVEFSFRTERLHRATRVICTNSTRRNNTRNQSGQAEASKVRKRRPRACESITCTSRDELSHRRRPYLQCYHLSEVYTPNGD
jgi:hypothetical protein